MKTPFTSAFNNQSDGFLIRAMVPDPGMERYIRTSFEQSRIERICEISERFAGIVLASGLMIPVLLSFAELEKKIYFRSFRDADVLDLCDKTGLAYVQATQMQIRAVARKADSQERIVFAMFEGALDLKQTTAHDGPNGPSTHLYPLPGVERPFNDPKRIIMDISKKEFDRLYKEAKEQQSPVLDLTAHINGRAPSKPVVRTLPRSHRF